MTYTALTDLIKANADLIHNVASFYTDDVYAAWGHHNVKYASVAVYLVGASRLENCITYNIMMYYGDRLTNDGANRDAIFDDGIRVLTTLVDDLPYMVEYDLPLTFNTFEQQFGDNLAGVYCNISLTVPFDQGTCGLPLITEEGEF